MVALLIGSIAALGVHYLYTTLIGWRGLSLANHASRQSRSGVAAPLPLSKRVAVWMAQAGIIDVTPLEFFAASCGSAVLSALLAFVTFGAVVPAAAVGIFASTAPSAAYRRRRARLRATARESWPRLIEEVRVQTSSVGRSVPVALLTVGRKAEAGPMRSAFEAAEREWMLTTDFVRTVALLKERLADPAADVVCETLLVAHDLGGADLDHRLRSLIDDRMADLEERRDAVSRQAGVKFARWFTLVVPVGMALVGMSIGNGRDAYRTAQGQAALLIAVGCTAACWIWAGRIMALPEAQRVLDK